MESVFRSDFLWGGACAANQKRQRTKRRIQTLLLKRKRPQRVRFLFLRAALGPCIPCVCGGCRGRYVFHGKTISLPWPPCIILISSRTAVTPSSSFGCNSDLKS